MARGIPSAPGVGTRDLDARRPAGPTRSGLAGTRISGKPSPGCRSDRTEQPVVWRPPATELFAAVSSSGSPLGCRTHRGTGRSWLLVACHPTSAAHRRGPPEIRSRSSNGRRRQCFPWPAPILPRPLFRPCCVDEGAQGTCGCRKRDPRLDLSFHGLRNGDDRVVRVPSIRLLLVLRISSWLQLSRREESWKPPRSCCCVTS